MCGIAGSANFPLPHETVRARMLHRGPDEQKGYTFGTVDFYHVRLSILDIQGGKQPMELDEKYVLIFNGQIYNHADLRQEHGLQGHTSSDTETLLMLYRKFGTSFLPMLEGMFAFAIHDRVNNTIFLARDRAGKKPLYYYADGKKFVFASSLDCLKALLPLEIEEKNFPSFLRLGSFYGEFTPYKNVSELKAGSSLVVDCSSLEITPRRWWNIHPYYMQSSGDSFEQSIEKVDTLLRLAVKRRIESSDLEVGSFLSGGIDSGLVTAIGSEYSNHFKTFTVSFEGEYDEAPLAELVARKYNTKHTTIPISFTNLKQEAETILASYGEPFFDPSAVPTYYVSREAKKHLTVILNGDGADELFAGYRRYVLFSQRNFFEPQPMPGTVAAATLKFLPMPSNKKSMYSHLHRMLALSTRSGLDAYFSALLDIMEGYETAIDGMEKDRALQEMKQALDFLLASPLTPLRKILNMDFDTYLFADLLVKMDVASMAHSLEARSPFLCKDLLEYAPTLPDNFKIHGTTTKHLLRKLAEKYLPSPLPDQPKRGFEVPLKKWVNGELKELVHDYVSAPGALHRRFLKADFAGRLLERRIRIPEEKRARILWMLLSLEIWYRKNYMRMS